jgi:hypothetical protein
MPVPSYYQITNEEDVHAFIGRWLTGASWEVDIEAMRCHLLYFNAFRYMIRLPHKAETPAETLRDLAKAIDCLEQLRAVLITTATSRSIPMPEEHLL